VQVVLALAFTVRLQPAYAPCLIHSRPRASNLKLNAVGPA
jgi:hypothetical protein